MRCDIVDIALVYSGYKPMCCINELPDFIDQLKLNINVINRKGCDIFEYYVIGKIVN